ncbi:formamidopyrimidine-DNA glycosylase isoform X2 [Amborella trichopoda]|uniref:formamidopyrimidine-DNA glycosylase isoform X2 n=1 Tax=Amborella trichopoda TaxID=13333 RepID=UPI0009C046F1|nr:formamidopyrimidine-DNA glycosylase isoform X2 [Amborella trichopoda]|eukprot:XP_020530607.1 formamidopyrimidine-DNA glycosylase isoform X2 [Amborella trichopoda]
MPELPEVEAARRAVEEHCIGKRIKSAKVADDPKVIEGVSPPNFEKSLVGKTIVAAHRKGKHLWLQLGSPPFPTFQFGMSGAVYIKGVAVTKYKRAAVNDTDEWPSKYSKVFIELDDGLELSFTDKRRFARVRLLQDPTSVPPISELGPDALLEPMTADEFANSLNKKKLGIKALLLDQSYISGIGNWVADEVLYQARIHPLQHATSLSKESCVTLHKSINEVVKYAVQVDADCSCFPANWIFHFRWGKKPGKLNGKRIEFITAGGRTSAFVPELQKLSGAAAEKVRKKTTNPKKVNEDDEDNNSESGEERDTETELKKEKATKRGRPKPSAKGKTITSPAFEEYQPKKTIRRTRMEQASAVEMKSSKSVKAVKKDVSAKKRGKK